MSPIAMRIADKADAEQIWGFLERPDIDHSFNRPLSERAVTIRDRVVATFQKGKWYLASSRGAICGCRGVKFDPLKLTLSFTTFVVDPSFRGMGIGQRLFRYSAEDAIATYQPALVVLDSWETNAVFEHIVLKHGFHKHRIFADPAKRPAGIGTVEYILELIRSNCA